ncbi:MAG: NUDIX domain-containing protein [Candidatus Zambryskibacteria bacterium]|nr:NUDIX domain-containing protein [Candidatus Zambryskibacteria bacterium]
MEKILNKELHRVVTTTLVYKPNFTYLITRRALHKVSHPGRWTIPGGGLSVDDYINTKTSEHGPNLWYGILEKSLSREIKEEVGLTIGKPELITDMTFIRPDGIPVVVFSYMAPYLSGEVKINQDLDGDTVDFAWVTFKEAQKYDLIGGLLDEIRQADKILKARKLD